MLCGLWQVLCDVMATGCDVAVGVFLVADACKVANPSPFIIWHIIEKYLILVACPLNGSSPILVTVEAFWQL